MARNGMEGPSQRHFPDRLGPMERVTQPLVLLPACQRWLDGQPMQTVRQQYLEALNAVGLQALIVPTFAVPDWAALLPLVQGVLLTGSPSNVDPSHYGQALETPHLPQDPGRDAAVLPLVPQVLARGLPLLAICRGFQEMNVALGGSLYQQVHALPNHADHRDLQQPYPSFDLAHAVQLTPGGCLATLLDTQQLQVNSVHGQGVARLADGLRVEARAPDGLVEAFTSPSSPGFNLGVQWHPEWQVQNNPASLALFDAFAAACRQFKPW
jgi:putative glutamine amidotransferase